MKPKFRLRVHVVGLPADAVHCYWTCSVTFSSGRAKLDTLHSGPCITSQSAIGEAIILMYRAINHAYR